MIMSVGQEFLPTPDVVGQTYRHRRTPTSVTASVRKVIGRFTQGRMRAQPITLEQAQDHSSIPRLPLLSKGMGLACQTVQPVTQHPIQAFFVNRIGTRDGLAPYLVYLDTHHLAPQRCLTAWVNPTPGVGTKRGRPRLPRRCGS
jgi:hypothetical protein